MKKIVTVLVGLFLLPHAKVMGQESSDLARDREIIFRLFSNVRVVEGESPGDLMVRVALFFLNTPYVGGTLEVGDDERLIINLRELDCTTFMETCVAVTRTLLMNRPDFESYCMELQRIRYRNGGINGYVSRLHYTTDWIWDNAAKGVVEDISKAIGGIPFQVKLSFMSSNTEKYPHLQGQPERTARIKQIEDQINRRANCHYIPKWEIAALQEGIKSGDIIAFTTSIGGMDVSHIGIAYWQDKTLTFVHASSAAKKVIVNPESISEYCFGINSNTGIMVVRVK